MSDESIQTAMQPSPGVSYDMPAEQYHAIEALSATGSKKLLRSPAHYLLERKKPSKATDAMKVGTAVHLGVLEPHLFETGVVEMPAFNARSSIERAERDKWLADRPGVLALDADTLGQVHATVDAIRSHPGAQRLLAGGRAEVSLQWRDARYDVPCKSRVDLLREDGGMVDVKTCEDASPEAFQRTIASYLYHLQAAFYMTGAEHLFHTTPPFFAFIAAEKQPPYGVACYVLDADAILVGQRHVETALRRYRECIDAGAFPAYSDLIETISVPKWARTF